MTLHPERRHGPDSAGQRWHGGLTPGTTPSTGCSAAASAARTSSTPSSTSPRPAAPSVASSARDSSHRAWRAAVSSSRIRCEAWRTGRAPGDLVAEPLPGEDRRGDLLPLARAGRLDLAMALAAWKMALSRVRRCPRQRRRHV